MYESGNDCCVKDEEPMEMEFTVGSGGSRRGAGGVESADVNATKNMLCIFTRFLPARLLQL